MDNNENMVNQKNKDKRSENSIDSECEEAIFKGHFQGTPRGMFVHDKITPWKKIYSFTSKLLIEAKSFPYDTLNLFRQHIENKKLPICKL